MTQIRQNNKVIVAMSGGVDSSVAAGLLHEAGYEVIGLFMQVGTTETTETVCASGSRPHQSCCSAVDAADARSVAELLNVPFYALDFAKDFDRIIDYFVDEYALGRTPNPCVICNSRLKFGKLLDYADAIGAHYVATGHHARVVERDGQRRLCTGTDPGKDQSYALFGIPAGCSLASCCPSAI